jgi:hypothetical protein
LDASPAGYVWLMGLMLAFLILVIAFALLGFVLKALFVVAAVLFLVWLIGFAVGGTTGGWYRHGRRPTRA